LYKYIILNADGSVARWQEGPNNTLDLGKALNATSSATSEPQHQHQHQQQQQQQQLVLDVKDSWDQSCRSRQLLRQQQQQLGVLQPRATAAAAAAAVRRPVVFSTQLKVDYGQAVGVVGSCEGLGCWDVSRAVLLQWSDGHKWSDSAELVAG